MDVDFMRFSGPAAAGSPKRPAPRPSSERPCYKLTVELLSTYKLINEKFYESKRKRAATENGDQKLHNGGYDDDQGNYRVQTGEEIAGRYIVQEVLGKGSFGVVCKAHDHRKDEAVAIKIIKNKVQFFHQAKVEIEILTKLNGAASEEHNIVKLKKVFSWKDHLCLVFELLSFNLYDLLKYTKFGGVSLNLVRKFAFQILKTLEFLAQPTMGVIHCDLKPENILLKNPKRSGIKVIDFGSSCHVTKRMFKYIQSRFYRSPEVILGLNYDCAIDMWSLACILVEMHTGHPLFDGKDEMEQLLKMSAVLQPPPNRMVDASPKRNKFFVFNAVSKKWDFRKENTFKRRTLEDILGMTTGGGGPGGRRKGQAGHTEQDYLHFVDLLKKMLTYNPQARMVPAAALHHPFLNPVADPDPQQSRILSPLKPPVHSDSFSHSTPTAGVFRDRSRSRDRSRDRGISTERRDSRIAASASTSQPAVYYRPEREGRPVERRSSLTSVQGTTAYGASIRSSSHTQRAYPTSSVTGGTGGNARARSSSIVSNTGSSGAAHFHSSATRSSSNGSVSHLAQNGYANLNLAASSSSNELQQLREMQQQLQRLQEQHQKQQELIFPAGRVNHAMAASPSSAVMRGSSPTSPAGLRLKPKQPGGTGHADPMVSPLTSPRKYGLAGGVERKLRDLALAGTPDLSGSRDQWKGLERFTSPPHKVVSPSSLDRYLENHAKSVRSPDLLTSGSWSKLANFGASPAEYDSGYAPHSHAHLHGGAEPMLGAVDRDAD